MHARTKEYLLHFTHTQNAKVHDGRQEIVHSIRCIKRNNVTFIPWPLGDLLGQLVHITRVDIQGSLRFVPQRHGQRVPLHCNERGSCGQRQ